MASAMMSFAPWMASWTVFTFLSSSMSSPVTYFAASLSTGSAASWARMYSARPSSPLALATLAFVLRLGR